MALEFAGVLVALTLIMLGTVEFGRLLWIRSTMQHAVEEAARQAMLNPAATSLEIADHGRASLAGMNPDKFTLSVTYESVGGVDYALVEADHNFELMAKIVPIGPVTLNAKMRVPRALALD